MPPPVVPCYRVYLFRAAAAVLCILECIFWIVRMSSGARQNVFPSSNLAFADEYSSVVRLLLKV